MFLPAKHQVFPGHICQEMLRNIKKKKAKFTERCKQHVTLALHHSARSHEMQLEEEPRGCWANRCWGELLSPGS